MNNVNMHSNLPPRNLDETTLTKREHFAAMAMQGLLYTYDVSTVATCGVMVVKDAVDYADLLLAELEK
jgi:hypothetical protein